MKQNPTGIDGLDKMLNGGIPSTRCILVSGGPGSGKTILGMQFLYHGAVRCNEPGLYVSLDEDTNQLKEEIQGFGWDIENLEKKGRLAMIDASPIRCIPGEVKVGDLCIGKRDFSLVSLMEIVEKKAKKIKAKRVVVDPITALTLQYQEVSEKRTAILDFIQVLTKLRTTNLITTELRSVALEREISTEEFLAHGVIVLHVLISNREKIRGIEIEKMRGIDHDDQIRPYRITKKGIEVFPQEKTLIRIDERISSLQH